MCDVFSNLHHKIDISNMNVSCLITSSLKSSPSPYEENDNLEVEHEETNYSRN